MINHIAADDLESFFYVFMWLCVLHDGPNGSVRTWPDDEDFIIHAWGEGAMRPGGLITARNAKSHFIYSPNSIIDKQFTPYFDKLKALAKEWKELVKEEDQHRQSGHSSPMHTARLSNYFTNTPTISPISIPLCLTSTSSPQHSRHQ